MNQADLERILDDEPLLNLAGFGAGDFVRSETLAERKARFERSREELRCSLPICQRVVQWLEVNVAARKTINTRQFSYGLKHVVEKEIGDYVGNGVFIAAAIFVGYRYKVLAPGSLNAYFNMTTVRRKQTA